MNELEKQELVNEFMDEVNRIAAELDDGVLPLEDLVQEGCLGLMNGIRLLDAQRESGEAADGGLSVSETLRHEIRAAMVKAIEQHKDRLRVDDRLVVQVELLNRSIERLTEELGTKPNIDEIANDMKVSQETVLKILRLTGDEFSDEELIPQNE